MKEFTIKQTEAAKKIMSLDIQKQGKIFKSKCPIHKKTELSYGWNNIEGVRIRCEICGWTTHFEPKNYQATPVDPYEILLKNIKADDRILRGLNNCSEV